MKDLEFTASDFSAAPTGSAAAMADWVNKKLARKLDKAPVVYFDDQETQNPDGYFEGTLAPRLPKPYHTHTAKLVCIEELK